MEEFGKLEERVVLVGVQTDDHDNVEESLDELKELASTAGAVTVGRIIQNRESVHPGTYIGKGKIEEVRALVYAMDATGIICDDELSPAQLNNLERELDQNTRNYLHYLPGYFLYGRYMHIQSDTLPLSVFVPSPFNAFNELFQYFSPRFTNSSLSFSLS